MGDPSKVLKNNHPDMQDTRNQQTSRPQAPPSFVEVTNSSVPAQEDLLTEDQGIIIGAIQGIPIKQYVYAVGEFIGKSHVKGAMRIPGNRISMYVSTPTLVDKLCSIDTNLFIGENKLILTPEKLKTRKVILSNIGLRIPNQAILKSFQILNIQPASQISKLNLSLDEGYAVLSSRRQVYINEEDILRIPESLLVTHDKMQYVISTTVDNFGCYTCHSAGHIAKNCPQISVGTQKPRATPLRSTNQRKPPFNNLSTPPTQLPNVLDSNEVRVDEVEAVSADDSTLDLVPTTQKTMELDTDFPSKRPASSSTDGKGSQDEEKFLGFQYPKKRTTKKTKTRKTRLLTPEFMRAHSTHLRKEMKRNPDDFLLDYDEFIELMDETFEFKDIGQQAELRELDPEILAENLREIQKFTDDITFKGRLTKMANKLESMVADPEENGYLSASSN